MSPTARTLQYLRKAGAVAQVVEKWNPHSKTRLDLFGCIDIVVLRAGKIVGIQATSGDNHASRMTKALAEPRLKDWMLCGGRFEVWSWAKRGAKGKRKLWTSRIQETYLSNGEPAAREENA